MKSIFIWKLKLSLLSLLWKLNYPFHKIGKILISSRVREIEDGGLEFYFSITFQLASSISLALLDISIFPILWKG